MKTRPLFFLLAISLCLGGCASQPELLYSWGSYEAQVYARLNGESSPHTQLGEMELDLQKILTSGKRLPPGFYAHMGMLYAETGNYAGAIASFMSEKASFPESVVFMNLLLERLVPPETPSSDLRGE